MEWNSFDKVTPDGIFDWASAVSQGRKLSKQNFQRCLNFVLQQAFENPEDIRNRENVEIKKDEAVERVRRAHLNDLENIPAFLIAGLFFVCTEPNVDLALWLFRIAVLARIAHTIVSSHQNIIQLNVEV